MNVDGSVEDSCSKRCLFIGSCTRWMEGNNAICYNKCGNRSLGVIDEWVRNERRGGCGERSIDWKYQLTARLNPVVR